MYKPSKNPLVLEVTKSSKKRQYALGNLDYVIREDGSKGCIWCGDQLKSKHPNARYCKDPLCMKSAWAWSNPQGLEGRIMLVIRQDFKCNICQFDWKPFEKDLIRGANWKLPANKAPEVDHILAIVNGGQSLGFDNHQAICYECHKAKTKADVKLMAKTPRVKKTRVRCTQDACRKNAKWECRCGLKLCIPHFNAHFSSLLNIPNSIGPGCPHQLIELKVP